MIWDRTLYTFYTMKAQTRYKGSRLLLSLVILLQTRGGAEEAHVWPSMSVGGQQSSLISYGTAWHLRAAPCSSEATVDISPQQRERISSSGRKRPLPGAFPAVRADQVLSSCCLMLISSHCPVKS